MGYEVEFKCIRCELNISKEQIDVALKILQKQAGPGPITLPNGISYGGENYLLNELSFTENPYEVLISAFTLEMYGKKNGNDYQFYRIHSKSKWTVERTIDSLKQIFCKYNGTLEGYFEGEDGAKWGHFIIEKGNENSGKKEQKQISPIYTNDVFKDVDINLMTAYITPFLNPEVRIIDYFVEIGVEESRLSIPVVASLNKEMIVILAESRPWNSETIGEIQTFIKKLQKSKYQKSHTYLVSGYPPPTKIEELMNKINPSVPNIFLTGHESQAPHIDINKLFKDTKPISTTEINIDFTKRSKQSIEDISRSIAISLPNNEYDIILDIGVKLNSMYLMERAFRYYEYSFDRDMDYESRHNSLVDLSEKLKSSHNEFLLKYIINNLDSWMTRDNVAIGLLPNLLEYSYFINDRELIGFCLEKIETIKDESQRSNIYKSTGIAFLNNGQHTRALDFFQMAINDIQKQDEEKKQALFTSICVELKKNNSTDTIQFYKDQLHNHESLLHFKERDINTLHYLINEFIEIDDLFEAKRLLERSEMLINIMQNESLIELANWYIATDALLLKDLSKFRSFICRALTIGSSRKEGPGWISRYGAEILQILGKQNNPEELNWVWQQFSNLNPPQTGPKHVLDRYHYAQEQLLFSLVTSYFILAKKRFEFREKGFNIIKGFSSKTLLDYMWNAKPMNLEILSEELLLLFDELAMANKDFEFFDSFLHNISLGYSALFPIDKKANYLSNIRKLREMTMKSTMYTYIQEDLIRVLVETGLIDEAIQESKSFIIKIIGTKNKEKFSQLVEFSERQIKYFKKTKIIDFLQLSIEAFNSISKFEDKKHLISPIILSLIDSCNNN